VGGRLLQHKRHLKTPDDYNNGVQDAVGKERAIPADDYIIAFYNLNAGDAEEEDNLDYSSDIDDDAYFVDISKGYYRNVVKIVIVVLLSVSKPVGAYKTGC